MPLDQVDVDKSDKNLSFLEHIEELRWHILRSLVAVFVGSVVAFIYGTWIFDHILFAPIDPDFPLYQGICKLSHWIYGSDKICMGKIDFVAQNLTISGQLTFHIIVAIVFGVIATFPYLLWEFWRFIRPALRQKERRYTTGFVFITSLLFMIGVAFGYYLLTPLSINFLANYKVSDIIQNQFTIQSYISFVTTLTLASGLIFELPLVIYILAKIGIVKASMLKQYRKHAVIAILVLASIITPPDVMSQILLSIPIYFLYEIGIFIAKRIEKRNALS
jgi:sec-independent protein translocase protein TatC